MKHNQSFGHYVDKFNKDTVAIYHNKFSNNSQIPILALKALSGIVGSHAIPKTAEKVVLIEKEEAIRIFGFLPGCDGSRSAYFATMAAYVLSHTGDPLESEKITSYRKQEYLKHRGQIEWKESSDDKP